MKKSVLIAVASLAIGFLSNKAIAQTQDTTKKDTAKTTAAPAATSTASASGDVVGVMATSTNYAPMALAIKSAQLEPTLQAPGPFTIFAPNDVAFSKLPKAQFDALMKDPAKFAPILKYHVVAGKYTKTDIIKALGAGKGKADLKTIDGQTLHLSVNDKSNLQITDAKGNAVLVTAFDTQASNGVVHGINGVMMP
ncbi:putative surface protein with fasciclin (FAS1) repeats [Mucilaginibacter sp. SG538B]|uniref:fasciclin domain-containing protein n=1 Tax=unclassified Mucilaginibacter TaxID=2617802 RepID=UPI00159D8688|nr:fasciclin domain-containing protein [Mucilaginibacter sp. SG538B]NVM63103.1 putative surface protein with fasciclin (FAS1) repeats [Mucilaginibacter sp. SG538B]